MSKGEVLACAYVLDGQGGGIAADWKAIDDWNPSQGLLWIHLDSELDETRVWLENERSVGFSECVRCAGKGVISGEMPVSVSFPAGLTKDRAVMIPLDQFGIPNTHITVLFRPI